MMRRYQTWAAVLLFLVGLLATFEARKLNLGEFGRPGPGFFPFCLALVFTLVSLALILRSLGSAASEQASPQRFAQTRRAKKVVTVLLGLVVYAFALEWLGFLLSTLILMLFLFKAIDPLGWPAAIGGSIATALLSYVVFKIWLQIALPAGLLGV
jgi:putative tricarboxylic transport membrane protein